MTEQRNPRREDPGYLQWIASLPCCICQTRPAEAAHLRTGKLNVKRDTGMAEKSSDYRALPLCRTHHIQQHAMNELEFWFSHGIDPFALSVHYQKKRQD